MITAEVRKWLEKVERKQYSYSDALETFIEFSSFLSREEMRLIKRKIEEAYK